MVYIQEQARRRGTSVGCRVDDKGNYASETSGDDDDSVVVAVLIVLSLRLSSFGSGTGYATSF